MNPVAEPGSADAEARKRIEVSTGESLLVEASAGTGKTTQLVRRIVRVVSRGAAPISAIAAVTFTNKAAGELKIRLRQALDEARPAAQDELKRRCLEHALEHLEEASIGTIHAFCAQLLRERPVEARVDPAFEQLTEAEAQRLYDRAFSGWFQDALQNDSPALRRALARVAWKVLPGSENSTEALKAAGWKLVEWRDHDSPWTERRFNLRQAIDGLAEYVRTLDEAAGRCTRPRDNLVDSLLPLRQLATWMQRSEQVAARDYAALEALLLKLEQDLKRRGLKKGSGLFAEGLPREQVVKARADFMLQLENFRREAGASLAFGLRTELAPLVERYERIKAQAGKLDFLDLLLRARNLLRDNREVREYFQGRFQAIFVDEFQDTDPLQAEVLLLLSADNPAGTRWIEITPAPGKLFTVGDPKQSIYKFRRADVTLYEQVRHALLSRGAGGARLSRNFRSLKALQQLVNAAFEPEMTGAAGQTSYAPLDEDGAEIAGQPAVVVVPAPRPYGKQRISERAINQCLPAAVANFIRWLVNQSQWKVRGPDGSRVPVESRHVCILFRRFTSWGTDMTGGYVRALEEAGIPHLVAGSKSFHERPEVEMLRAALTAIEWPDDELAVFATLKGSLFALEDALLFRFREAHGRLHPFKPLPGELPSEFQPVASALAVLAGLHRQRNQRPMSDTINVLLEAARVHAGLLFRPSGQQALANLYRVCDLARTFEATGGISFRGFVEELNRQAEKTGAPEAPVLEEAAEGVRLMTVHSAKGLEFPVVVLADMTANLAARDPQQYVDGERALCATRLLGCSPWELLDHEGEELDRERAEGVRVAYVAATRARDLLVVTSVGDEARDGWLQPLNKAIYPAYRKRRQAQPAPPLCPPFPGHATVLERPMEYAGEPEDSVQPGAHEPEKGNHTVVWWDPLLLEPSSTQKTGIVNADFLVEGPDTKAEEGLAKYHAWSAARESAIAAGSRAEFEILTPSSGGAGREMPTVRLETVAQALGRPTGTRFGTLVHATMRDAGFDMTKEQLRRIALMHGRVAGASEAEVEAAAEAASAALAHPIMRRAAAADERCRELPVICRLDGNQILEGVIDLAFREADRWIVIDFKSDVFLAGNTSRYETQLQLYVDALSKITAQPAEGVLLSL